MNLKRTLLLLAAVLPLQLSAKVTLPAIFTDNMVLQQQSDVKIWGRAKPGKAVKVTTSWDGKTYAATASATGGACRPPWPAAPIPSRFRTANPSN